MNIFVTACAEVVLEAIHAGIPVAVWSLDIYRCLLDLCPAIAQLDWCRFGSRFRRRTTMWSWNLYIPSVSPRCFPHGNVSPIRRVKLERQGISLTRGVCEIRWLLGSSAPGNKTRYYVVGIPAASQSLNTGTREASVSDAAVHVRCFEALAVSHPLHGKTANQKCYGLGRSDKQRLKKPEPRFNFSSVSLGTCVQNIKCESMGMT